MPLIMEVAIIGPSVFLFFTALLSEKFRSYCHSFWVVLKKMLTLYFSLRFPAIPGHENKGNVIRKANGVR